VEDGAMEKLNEMSVADRYRAAAENFSRLVDGVADWDAPSPVKEWTARDVVGHLVTWVPGMVGGGSGLAFPEGLDAATDPVGAWRGLDARVRGSRHSDEAGAIHSNPHTGEAPVDKVIDQYVSPDLVFHAWDLGKASGQDPELDEDFMAGAYAGMSEASEMIRGSGQFGEQQSVAEDASITDKFFAFIGRDPNWTP
jgi:uncharacterized protein (TIGR03086 family)